MNGEQISSLERFLDYGPVGLAGLMLVLVVLALSLSKLTEERASLLKFFMVVGALCFGVSVIAQIFEKSGSYEMKVAIVPEGLEESPHSAPPSLKIDGEKFDYGLPHLVEENFSVLIDLTSSVDSAENAIALVRTDLEAELEKLKKARSESEERLKMVSNELDKFQAIQDALSGLQSDAPSLVILKVSRQLDQQIKQFLTNVGRAIE